MLRIVVASNYIAVRTFCVCKILPQLNEEDVDSAHGTEQQRLDCDWKAQEDCHLVGFNG